LEVKINACLNLLKMWRGSGSAESLSVSVMKLGCKPSRAEGGSRKIFDSLALLLGEKYEHTGREGYDEKNRIL